MDRLILFDFFKTLTDDVFFFLFPDETRKEITRLLFKPPNHEIWERPWMSGRISSDDVFRYLSEHIGYSRSKIEEKTLRGIRAIRWNPRVWSYSQNVRKAAQTAIVTINCDLFKEFIVPAHKLNSYFDALVCSAETGMTEKVDLCRYAARLLTGSESLGRALLIDDKSENTGAVVDAGGQAILYQGDAAFSGPDYSGDIPDTVV